MRALLVGGPADGRVIACAPDTYRVNVALEPRVQWSADGPSVDTVGVEVVTYWRRPDLEAQPPGVVVIFTPDPISTAPLAEARILARARDLPTQRHSPERSL